MCGMTETGARAYPRIAFAGRYIVSRGNYSGLDLYIKGPDAENKRWHGLYAIRVKCKPATSPQRQGLNSVWRDQGEL